MGGPVLNAQAQVIGVAVATFSSGQNLNFAIPASYLAQLSFFIPTSVAPLPRNMGRLEKSILSELGVRSTEGIVGGLMTWDGCCTGRYSFSLRNEMRVPVRDVVILVVFYDPFENPLDFNFFSIPDVIPAGLAKRISKNIEVSVANLNSPNYERRSMNRHGPESRVEFRILDFKIVE